MNIQEMAAKLIAAHAAIQADRKAGGTEKLQSLIAEAGVLKSQCDAAGYTNEQLTAEIAAIRAKG